MNGVTVCIEVSNIPWLCENHVHARRSVVYHWTLWTQWIALCPTLTMVTGIQCFRRSSHWNFLIRSWLTFTSRWLIELWLSAAVVFVRVSLF